MSPDHRSTNHGIPGGAGSRGANAGRGGRGPLMPEVMDAMSAAVTRRAAPARRRRRWLGRGSLLGVVVVLGSGTALAATGQWNPFPSGHHQGFSLKPAPLADRSTLAVLRRPQTAQDRSPLIVAFLRRQAVHAGSGNPNRFLIHLPSIRFLRPAVYSEMGGWNGKWHRRSVPASLVLMPSEVAQVFPLDGAKASTADKRAAAAHRPQHALCLWTIADNWPVGATPPMLFQGPPARGHKKPQIPNRPRLLDDRVTGGGTCVSLHRLRTTGVVEGVFNYGELTGMVPDGVASVRITTRTGVVMTQKVVNNTFQLAAPGHDKIVPVRINGHLRTDEPAKSSQFRHQTLQWLAADGRIIRHVPL